MGDAMMARGTVSVVTALLMAALCAMPSAAQSAIQEDFQPSTLNQAGQEYPQVNSQGLARYRILAPDAHAVTVDGGVFNDPGTWNFYGSVRWEGGLEVPAHNRRCCSGSRK
jgi:hypothetical protein